MWWGLLIVGGACKSGNNLQLYLYRGVYMHLCNFFVAIAVTVFAQFEGNERGSFIVFYYNCY